MEQDICELLLHTHPDTHAVFYIRPHRNKNKSGAIGCPILATSRTFQATEEWSELSSQRGVSSGTSPYLPSFTYFFFQIQTFHSFLHEPSFAWARAAVLLRRFFNFSKCKWQNVNGNTQYCPNIHSIHFKPARPYLVSDNCCVCTFSLMVHSKRWFYISCHGVVYIVSVMG